jgi:hypothetical protein
MEDIPLFGRIVASLKALGILWFVSGIAFGAHFRDVSASFLFFFWSMPYFAAGWVLAGIPVIAIGSRVLKIPVFVLGILGAAVGFFVILFFPLLDWTIHLMRPVAGVRYGLDLRWSYLIGWPGFCASLGAGGMIIYRWLFSRAGAAGWGAIPPPD